MARTRRALYQLVLLASVAFIPIGTAHAYTVKGNSDGHPLRWDAERIELRIDPAAAEFFSAGDLRTATEMAAEAWRGFPGVPDIVVEDGAPPPFDPDRRHHGIYVVSPWPLEGNPLAATLSRHDRSGEIVGVDIWINGDQDLALLDEDGSRQPRFDLASTLTHEMGHVLGLGESHAPDAAMNPQLPLGSTTQRSLAHDDEAGIIALYSENPPMPGSVSLEAPATHCSANPGRAGGRSDWSAPALLLIGGLALICRHRRRRERSWRGRDHG